MPDRGSESSVEVELCLRSGSSNIASLNPQGRIAWLHMQPLPAATTRGIYPSAAINIPGWRDAGSEGDTPARAPDDAPRAAEAQPPAEADPA